MRIKSHKRKQLICQFLSRMAAVIIWIGIFEVLGMSWRILVGMSPIQDAGWMPVSLAAMAAGYAIGLAVRRRERRRMGLGRKRKK